ncbi:hypothetical protein QZM22_13255 [Burkholderia oklahomensis]|uniref:hypothetical protein n=1 Tax=Burkholderia oklahomensis TaxID=342113 RepID=UPI00264AF568|nr:hypothetical protein [Burkholderia oklahomensis]MDN7673461.1 hypothetical protein [Burkholderia oklahomensis]
MPIGRAHRETSGARTFDASRVVARPMRLVRRSRNRGFGPASLGHRCRSRQARAECNRAPLILAGVGLRIASASPIVESISTQKSIFTQDGNPDLAYPVRTSRPQDRNVMTHPERAGRAVSQAYPGIAAATLFGTPLGTVAANAIGWRGSAK